MIWLKSLSCQEAELGFQMKSPWLHRWKAFYYCLLTLKDPRVEQDSGLGLPFAKQELCLLFLQIQKNGFKIYWPLFHPSFYHLEHFPSSSSYSSPPNFEWDKSFSKDIIRYKDLCTRIKQQKINIKRWIMGWVNPGGSKFSQNFLVVKGKREISSLRWFHC